MLTKSITITEDISNGIIVYVLLINKEIKRQERKERRKKSHTKTTTTTAQSCNEKRAITNHES